MAKKSNVRPEYTFVEEASNVVRRQVSNCECSSWINTFKFAIECRQNQSSAADMSVSAKQDLQGAPVTVH